MISASFHIPTSYGFPCCSLPCPTPQSFASSWTVALVYPVSTPDPDSSVLTGSLVFPSTGSSAFWYSPIVSAPELVGCVREAPVRRFQMKNTVNPMTANTNNGTTTPIAAFTPVERSGFEFRVGVCVRDDVVDVDKVCCLRCWICYQPPTRPNLTRDRGEIDLRHSCWSWTCSQEYITRWHRSSDYRGTLQRITRYRPNSESSIRCITTSALW